MEGPVEWSVKDGPAKGWTDEEEADWCGGLVVVVWCEEPES